MDIDEEAFRQGHVSAELFGYLTVPRDEARVQGGKAGRAQSDENALDTIAFQLMDGMDADALYILGPGSTVFGVKQRLGIYGTLLGVDVTRMMSSSSPMPQRIGSWTCSVPRGA